MRVNRKKWGYIVIAIVIVIFFVIRSIYGAALSDELCYLASLKRYLQGDRFLLDDWHPPTQLTSWIIYQVVRWIPNIEISVLGSRLCYLAFQLIVAGLCIVFMRGKKGCWVVALMYLCSVPYNILALSYNSIPIAMFTLICCCLFTSEGKKWRWILSGVFLAIAGLCNPYLALIYILYVVICIVYQLRHKKNELFSINTMGHITIGAAIVGVIFVVSLLGKGGIEEYYYNITMIFNDSEHQGNANILYKLFRSQWLIIRVYWRVAVPLGIIGLITILDRKKLSQNRKTKYYLFVFSCLFVIYGTIRFAFIYGSISINMMLVPLSFLGVEISLLIFFGTTQNWSKVNNYFIWLILGYLFSVCNFLSTNTEILSMSAMFVVPAMSVVFLTIEYLNNEKTEEKFIYIVQVTMSYLCIGIYIFCMFYLRMTFIWYDGELSALNTRISRGPAVGIYTSVENARNYNRIIDGIDMCKITEEDKVLFLPMDPLCYYYSDGEIATPYVTRFEASLEELISYYDSHHHKLPTKVIFTDCENGEISESKKRIATYYIQEGYKMVVINETFVMLQK